MSFPLSAPSVSVQLSESPPRHIPVLEEVKGLAILLVVLYHAGGVLVWNNYLHGDIGVDIFLVLSGLGLALNRREETAKSFFSRRLIRLFPLYWLLLAAFAVCNEHFLQHHYSWVNLLAHATGLHCFFGDPIAFAINDSFWFVSAILFLYVCFWFTRGFLTRLDRFVLIAGIVSGTVALGLFWWNQPGLFGHVGYRVPGFFLGMAIGQCLRSGKVEVAFGPEVVLGILAFTYFPYTQGIILYPPIVGLALICGYIFIPGRVLLPEHPLRGVFRFLGRHSLEIFLLHQPLIREYNYYLHGRWFNVAAPSAFSLSIGMAIGITVTLLLAVELHRLQDRFLKP